VSTGGADASLPGRSHPSLYPLSYGRAGIFKHFDRGATISHCRSVYCHPFQHRYCICLCTAQIAGVMVTEISCPGYSLTSDVIYSNMIQVANNRSSEALIKHRLVFLSNCQSWPRSGILANNQSRDGPTSASPGLSEAPSRHLRCDETTSLRTHLLRLGLSLLFHLGEVNTQWGLRWCFAGIK